MPDHRRGHVTSRPTLSRPASDGEANSRLMIPSSGDLKRKNIDDSGAATDFSKRSRGSSSLSRHSAASNTPSNPLIPATIPETEDEPTFLPLTPVGQNFVVEPVTPTPRAPSGSVATPKAGEQLPIPAAAVPVTPPKPSETTTLSSALTPMRLSSSNVDPSCIPPHQSSSQTSRGPEAPRVTKLPPSHRSSQTLQSNKVTQLGAVEMEEILKHELRGSVFEHEKFFDEFLDLDQVTQKEVREAMDLRSTSHLAYDSDKSLWNISAAIAMQRVEDDVYQPLAEMLNAIGLAAFGTYHARHPLDSFRGVYRPFLDHSSSAALFDSPSDAATKPDLVKAGHERKKTRAHWGDMELVIECKSQSDRGSRNEAFMQLARYSRAVFAHQIYRLRAFGFSLCGSIVNFVCFDRSGLLHSPDIDLSDPDQAHSFVQHVITLLTIPPEEFGYDTRYTFRQRENSNIIDTLFEFPGRTPEVVNEIICYRKCSSGRATCVCGLGDKVHKGIWRPEERPDEGETMARFKGVWGVCQMETHDHSKYSTRLKYSDKLKLSPSAYFFYPGAKAKSVVGSTTTSARSKSTSAQPSRNSSRPSSATSVCAPVPAPAPPRGVRIKSDILMPRGTSLFEAQNPLHLLMAIYDALMGIMAFTEAGKIHCDISAYNLLLINPNKHYANQNWLEPAAKAPVPDVWKRTASGSHSTTEEDVPNFGLEKSECVCPRLKRAEGQNRGPCCVVHDTEFTVDEDRTEDEVHTDRTGTPAFISAQLLLDLFEKEPRATRTFIHDVESLFWVLVWLVVHRSQERESWEVNEAAIRIMQKLSDNNMESLGTYKAGLLAGSVNGTLEKTIAKLDNDWSKELAPAIADLGTFLYFYLYYEVPARDQSLYEHLIQRHNLLVSESRDATFDRLFYTLDQHTEPLRQKYSVNLGAM